MQRGDYIIARYEAFHKEARASYERAADGPQKVAASLEFRLADAAERSGNEVDWLLATYRGIRALE
ncbi:hypothetical protein [Marivita lacus]|nr:hypothetical protein [Marivita lacus]